VWRHPAIMEAGRTYVVADGNGQCRVLSGGFAMLIQLLLAVASGISLVVKRIRENPRRPLLIWSMDSSKQAAALGAQHFVNIALAVFWSDQKASECIWFAANLLVAVLVGLCFLAAYMRLFAYVVHRFRWHCLESGNYGHVTHPRLEYWLAQTVHWVLVSCIEKFITAATCIVPFYRPIDDSLYKLEAQTGMVKHPNLELVLVMVIVPAFLNAVYAWVVDNIIKQHETSSNNGPRSLESRSSRAATHMLSGHSNERSEVPPGSYPRSSNAGSELSPSSYPGSCECSEPPNSYPPMQRPAATV